MRGSSRGMAFRGLLVSLAFRAPAVGGAELPTAVPEDVGMSSKRLLRINDSMNRHIEAGDIQGGVTAVARRGKVVHFEAHGLMDVGAGKPM